MYEAIHRVLLIPYLYKTLPVTEIFSNQVKLSSFNTCSLKNAIHRVLFIRYLYKTLPVTEIFSNQLKLSSLNICSLKSSFICFRKLQP